MLYSSHSSGVNSAASAEQQSSMPNAIRISSWKSPRLHSYLYGLLKSYNWWLTLGMCLNRWRSSAFGSVVKQQSHCGFIHSNMCSLSYSIRIASLKHMCVALVGFSYSNLCVEVSHNQDFRDRRTHHDRGTDTTTPADVRIIVVVRPVCLFLLWFEVCLSVSFSCGSK